MKKTIRDHLQVEIKSPERNPCKDNGDDVGSDHLPELTAPFFGSSSHYHQKNENTWIISLFVVVHLLAFAASMLLNDCPANSNGNCVLAAIGRLSFQPLQENPLLGPSSSTLVEMGTLEWKSLTEKHQIWRLLTCPWLHAGAIHLVINLASVIFIGIHLEQAFGSLRIGIIYMLSAFTGSLMAASFVHNSPAVGSSGALFGLLGAMFSGLIQYWKVYNDKSTAIVALFLVAFVNFALGLLPYVDNFANIGGFLSGFLLGSALLFNPHVGQVPQNKRGLFEYNDKTSVKAKHKFDMPILRSISLVFFTIFVAGGLVLVLHGIDANKYCNWCHYINCVPSKNWNCSDTVLPCEVIESAGRISLTCKSNDNFRIYPFTNVSEARMWDLCSQILLLNSTTWYFYKLGIPCCQTIHFVCNLIESMVMRDLPFSVHESALSMPQKAQLLL